MSAALLDDEAYCFDFKVQERHYHENETYYTLIDGRDGSTSDAPFKLYPQ
jgi:hypothetical protein